MRRPIALVLAVILLGLCAAPVSAAATRRTWYAGMGTSAAYGRTTLRAFADGTATTGFTLKSLRRNTTYRVEIRAGRCRSLGSVLARPGSVRTGATGAATASLNLSASQMNSVWGTARTGTIAVRVVATGSAACGDYYFNKATRVRIPAYGIDLPVIAGPSGYPPCRVALYQKVLSQPTEPGVTFIYAHAQKGMFLPLLTASKVNNGAAMVGQTVYVYASNSVMHTYTITRVRRHVRSVQDAFSVTGEKLWLQTSEGYASDPKLIIEATRTGTRAATYVGSHPTPHPVSCH
jgi:hypothetical protein